MQEFRIRLGSVKDVQDFVAVATTRGFAVTVRDDCNKIDAESFMELFCLDFSQALRVVCDCSEEQLTAFRHAISRFLTEE